MWYKPYFALCNACVCTIFCYMFTSEKLPDAKLGNVCSILGIWIMNYGSFHSLVINKFAITLHSKTSSPEEAKITHVELTNLPLLPPESAHLKLTHLINWCEEEQFQAIWKDVPSWYRYCHQEEHTNFDYKLPTGYTSSVMEISSQMKLVAYADDICVLLDSIYDLNRLKYHIDKYTKVSNTKFNTHKTEAFSLNEAKIEKWDKTLYDNNINYHDVSSDKPY
ncbi:unnamed protein product [Cunninghamella blakesleeana]